MNKHNEPLSEHPLFRALVLMGGGLALSCGGVARTEPDPTTSNASGSGGNGGASSAGGSAAAALGGSGVIMITDPGQGTATGGGSSAGEADSVLLDCPTEQYDCGATSQDLCGLLDLPSALATGLCVCDRFRPTSVKDCKPNENIVCLAGYLPTPSGPPADFTRRIRCTCIPSPVPASYENCSAACRQAGYGPSCTLPNPCTSNDSGVCTATSADVLYQSGILCGCANIGLK
jgi:hypothetical protein